MDDVSVNEMQMALNELKSDSKNCIESLTHFGRRCAPKAEDFVMLIQNRILTVNAREKLNFLYLLDSLLKSYPDHYKQIVSHYIEELFIHVFTQCDNKVRLSLFKLFKTWKSFLEIDLLQSINVAANIIDPKWPLEILGTQDKRSNNRDYRKRNQLINDPRKMPLEEDPNTIPQNNRLYSNNQNVYAKGHKSVPTGNNRSFDHLNQIRSFDQMNQMRSFDQTNQIRPFDQMNINRSFSPNRSENIRKSMDHDPRSLPPKNTKISALLKNLVSDLSNKIKSTDVVDTKIQYSDDRRNPKPSLSRNYLQSFNENTIIEHLKGKMCSNCSLRFLPGDNKYSDHLDWHFKITKISNEKQIKPRLWYFSAKRVDEELVHQSDFWTESIEKATKRIRSSIFEILPSSGILQPTVKLTSVAGKITFSGDPSLTEKQKRPSCVALVENADDQRCRNCNEKFDQFWHEELEEWHYENAIRTDDIAYHIDCQPSMNKTR